ncbi:TIGR02611 family protein [Frigoribacterium sp. 2-23]|uniref:TIGR02611 family protein n=1 Tax=Frigoribacterium sp. 2-23 TaxID=3415006 RepID=UPI003C6FD5F4
MTDQSASTASSDLRVRPRPGTLTAPTVADDASSGRFGRFRAAWRARRARLDSYPRLRALYRVGVALAGLVVILVGLILVPLPGPGWLIVFLGVALLGTEFPAAHRVTRFVRRQAHRVRVWWRARRSRPDAVR